MENIVFSIELQKDQIGGAAAAQSGKDINVEISFINLQPGDYQIRYSLHPNVQNVLFNDEQEELIHTFSLPEASPFHIEKDIIVFVLKPGKTDSRFTPIIEIHPYTENEEERILGAPLNIPTYREVKITVPAITS